MPDLLIKNVERKVLNELELRAKRNNRSLQSEIQTVLKDAAENFKVSNDAELARKIKDSLRGRAHSDSVELLREDRAR